MLSPEQIKQCIDAGLQARQNRDARYQRLRGYYYNDPQDGYSTHYPIVQPVVDSLGAVVSTIVGVDPFFVPKCYKQQESEEFLSKVVQFFMEKDGYAQALKKCASVAGWANIAWNCGSWTGGALPGFKWRCIEPSSCVVYPSWSSGLEDAKMFGYSQNRRLSEVRRLQDEGVYTKGGVVGSESRADAERATAQMGQASKPAADEAIEEPDSLVTEWVLWVKEGKEVSRIVFAYELAHILKQEVWPYEAAGIAEHWFKPRTEIDGYWPSHSVANDVQEPQRTANMAVSNLVEGSRMATFGVVFLKRGLETAKAVTTFNPGDVIPVDESPKDAVMTYTPPVDLSYIPTVLSMMEQKGRDASRMGSMSRGNGDAGTDTATEAEYVQRGQSLSADDYLQEFVTGCSESCKYVQSVLARHFDEWFPVYKDVLGLDEAKETYQAWLALPVEWRPSVKSMGAAPSMQLASIARIAQMASLPGSGIDNYELVSRQIDLSERMGLVDADGVQIERDPADFVAQIAEKMGLEPDTVAIGIGLAAELEKSSLAERMDSMAGGGVLPVAEGGTVAQDGPSLPVAGNMQ